jgi:hypothetical protein
VIAVFLGAGFSAPAGVPLTAKLFDARPEVDRVTRERLVDRVLSHWHEFRAGNAATPEQYLAVLQANGGKAWLDAQWYVALAIALAMGRVEWVGMKPTVTRHNIDRTSGVTAHEEFWDAVFSRSHKVSVITTNYDILPERGIRHVPRPRARRPGFHYGWGSEPLAGGGYPSYAHIQKVTAAGSVPVYKLHGSISWSYRGGQLIRYHDCRPAIRGDAAIVAPVTTKLLPGYLEPVWEKARVALSTARLLLVVGYSLPEYDELVRDLLRDAAPKNLAVHIFDPDPEVPSRFESLLPGRTVERHQGLPQGLTELTDVLHGSWYVAAHDA